MKHTYDVDVALAVGNIADAVVLMEVARRCESGENADAGMELSWTYGSRKSWGEDFPELKNSIQGVFNRLESDGWLMSAKRNDSPLNHAKWYIITDKTVRLLERTSQKDGEDVVEIPQEQLFPVVETPPLTPSEPPRKKSGKPTIEMIMREHTDEIEYLYSLYPSTTESGDRGKRGTGKCAQDKARIANLLRTYTVEQIERSIKEYIRDTGGKFMKNFSTFLNNLPEFEEEDGAINATFVDDEQAEKERLDAELRAMGYQG